MDPRRKKHTAQSQDHPLRCISLKKTSARDPDQKPFASVKAPVHTHVQVKAMTMSLNAGNSSSFKRYLEHQSSLLGKTMEIQKGSSSDWRNSKAKPRRGRSEIATSREEEKQEQNRQERGVIINARKSFSDPEMELGCFVSAFGAKILAMDMPPFMQIHAVGCARKTTDALQKFSSKSLAFTVKKEFDGAYGPAWHCIVGTSFGSFVTHSEGGFVYFSMDKLYILVFKTTVHRAA